MFKSRKENADVILVSHDMGSVLEYCDRGIVLSHGRLLQFDRVDEAIEIYKS